MRLSGWGRYPVTDCKLLRPRNERDIVVALEKGPVIARGMGRSYGDSALNPDGTLDMTSFSRMLAFDPENGQLTVEAGVVLGDVVEVFMPRGWFPPVTPGTKYVTIGGMIAADVHGKNHHKQGSFGNFVDWLDLLGPDGEVRRCSRRENSELFAWTIGGMGLTGVILRAAFRLQRIESGWIRQRTVVAPRLTDAMAAFDAADDWTYSVAWIDCLASGERMGRSVLMLGEHAGLPDLDPTRRRAPFETPARRRLQVPLDAPAWALNTWTVRAFNALYYASGRRRQEFSLVDCDSYFYPLDAVLGWNRLYGRRGFAQFQCVLPLEASKDGLSQLLKTISAAGQGSFLAVLKRLGAQDGRFSFPMKGYTLALDVPINRTALRLLSELDRVAVDHGGRFYLAKDARMTKETFGRSEPRAASFRAMRAERSVESRFRSVQSERLGL